MKNITGSQKRVSTVYGSNIRTVHPDVTKPTTPRLGLGKCIRSRLQILASFSRLVVSPSWGRVETSPPKGLKK